MKRYIIPFSLLFLLILISQVSANITDCSVGGESCLKVDFYNYAPGNDVAKLISYGCTGGKNSVCETAFNTYGTRPLFATLPEANSTHYTAVGNYGSGSPTESVVGGYNSNSYYLYSNPYYYLYAVSMGWQRFEFNISNITETYGIDLEDITKIEVYWYGYNGGSDGNFQARIYYSAYGYYAATYYQDGVAHSSNALIPVVSKLAIKKNDGVKIIQDSTTNYYSVTSSSWSHTYNYPSQLKVTLESVADGGISDYFIDESGLFVYGNYGNGINSAIVPSDTRNSQSNWITLTKVQYATDYTYIKIYYDVSVLSVPQVTAPENGASLNSPVTISWSGDPDYTYQIQIAYDQAFTQLVVSTTTANTYYNTGTLSSGDDYYYRVKALYNGGESAWSVARYFTITNLTKPTITSPASGATVSLTPTLEWANVLQGGIYTLQISKGSFANPISYQVVGGSGATVTKTIPSGILESGTVYYARVLVTDPNTNNSSEYSLTRTFQTSSQSAPTAPNAPSITSPASNGSSVTTAPIIMWSSVGTGITYILQLDNNAIFTTPDVCVSVTTLNYQVPDEVLENGTWYARVMAIDPNNLESSWSSLRSFIYTESSPSPITLDPSTDLQGSFTIVPEELKVGDNQFEVDLVAKTTSINGEFIIRIYNEQGTLYENSFTKLIPTYGTTHTFIVEVPDNVELKNGVYDVIILDDEGMIVAHAETTLNAGISLDSNMYMLVTVGGVVVLTIVGAIAYLKFFKKPKTKRTVKARETKQQKPKPKKQQKKPKARKNLYTKKKK